MVQVMGTMVPRMMEKPIKRKKVKVESDIMNPKKEIVVVDCSPSPSLNEVGGKVDVIGSKNSVHIRTNFDDPCCLDLKLSNYYSKVLRKERLKNVGHQEIPLDLSSECEGIYVLKVKIDDHTQYEKMIIKIDR